MTRTCGRREATLRSRLLFFGAILLCASLCVLMRAVGVAPAVTCRETAVVLGRSALTGVICFGVQDRRSKAPLLTLVPLAIACVILGGTSPGALLGGAASLVALGWIYGVEPVFQVIALYVLVLVIL